MKHATTIVLTLLLLAGNALAISKLELGESDGFAESVQVSDYDAEKGTVRLITPDGVEAKPLSEFSDPVQQKILNWYADKVFMSSSGLRIKIQTKEWKREDKSEYYNGEIVYVHYIITLQNRSEIPVKDLTLTCRVFLDQWNAKTEDDDLQIYKEIRFLSDLRSGSTKVFRTKPIAVRDYVKKELKVNADGEAGHIGIQVEGKLQGMLLTVEKKSFDGTTLVRTEKEGRPPKEKKAAEYKYQEYKGQDFETSRFL